MQLHQLNMDIRHVIFVVGYAMKTSYCISRCENLGIAMLSSLCEIHVSDLCRARSRYLRMERDYVTEDFCEASVIEPRHVTRFSQNKILLYIWAQLKYKCANYNPACKLLIKYISQLFGRAHINTLTVTKLLSKEATIKFYEVSINYFAKVK